MLKILGLFLVATICGCGGDGSSSADKVKSEHYAERMAAFKLEKEPAGITAVVIGDSNTERQNPANFTESTALFGIGGDDITGVTLRIEVHLNSVPAAKHVFLAIGTNDNQSTGVLSQFQIQQYADLVNTVKSYGMAPFIVSIPPVYGLDYLNESAKASNLKLRDIAEKTGAIYVDLWPAVYGQHEYYDNFVHFNGSGYKVIADVLMKAIPAEAGTDVI